MTRAFTCTRCMTPTIGVPFGPRVLDEWCQSCWWQSRDSLGPNYDGANELLAEAGLTPVTSAVDLDARLKELERDILRAQDEVSGAEQALEDAEDELRGLEKAQRALLAAKKPRRLDRSLIAA